MLNNPPVQKLIRLALEEDLSFGDVTSELTVPADYRGHGEIVAREPLVACGLELPEMILEEMGADAAVTLKVKEGAFVEAGTVLAILEGRARELLSAERTILNFLQRACGVATGARRFSEKASPIVLLDTRKTMPGWRRLDKYAVSVGGGRNHRYSLADMVLVKNNHVDVQPGENAAQKMRNCLSTIFQKKPYFMPVEVEVRNMEELSVALQFKPQAVMLDNMTDEQIRAAMKEVKSVSASTLVEVSGNIRDERLEILKELGVPSVSVGGLTTRALNVDISLRLKTNP